MPDTTGSECLRKGRGSHVGQKHLKKLKRKVLRACVTQACLNLYLVTVALTEQQQQLHGWFWLSNNTNKRGLTKEG